MCISVFINSRFSSQLRSMTFQAFSGNTGRTFRSASSICCISAVFSWFPFPSVQVGLSSPVACDLDAPVLFCTVQRHTMERYTGRKQSPWRRPRTTIPKNIRKNIRNISEEANTVTNIPRNVLIPVSIKKKTFYKGSKNFQVSC